MKLALLLFLVVTQYLAATTSVAQEALAADRVVALKGVKAVATVLRENAPRQIVPRKEWFDMVHVDLGNKLPRLEVLSNAQSSSVWLELSVISTDGGAVISLTLYRWAEIMGIGEQAFVPVWSDMEAVFGPVSRRSAKETLDSLTTSFAADYLRANRR